MKTRHILAGLVFLALIVVAPNLFAATLTISSNTQMDKLEIVSGNDTVVMANGQDYILNLTGAGEAFVNSGTFTANTSTVKFSGADAQSMSGTLTFNKLTHDGAGALSLSANLVCTGLLTNTQGNFTPVAYGISASGVMWTAGVITATPSGDWDIGASGVDINGGTFVATSGAFTVAGNWDMTGSATVTPGDGTVTFDDAATITSAEKSFKAVTAAADVTLADAFVAGGALTINSGNTFTLAGNNCDAGSITNSGTFQMNGDETLATTTAITGGLVKFLDPEGCALSTSISGLPDVEFNSSTHAFTLSEDMTYITGNITVASGTTLTMGGYDMTLAAGRTVTNNGTWSVPTSESLFTCAGSATFAGGSINFYDFTRNPALGATLTFADGVTYTVKGVLTLKGAGSGTDILNIAKSGTGTNAVLSKDGTSSVEYVAVNGVNGVVDKIISASNSYAAGGAPLHWQFGTGTVAGGGDWNTAATWASGQVPGSEDDVTISENVTLDTDATVNSLNVSDNTLSLFDGETAHTLAVTDSVTVGGAIDVGIGALTAVGASDINGTLSISTGTYTANDSFDASGGTVTFTGTGTLNLAGTVACGGLGTFTKATGTVDYKMNGAQNVSAVDYYHLKLSTGGTKTLCGSIDVDGTLTVNDSGVTFDVADPANNINIAGNWSNSGTFTNADGTVTFDGTSAVQQITCGTSSPFYNLTINNTADAGADDIILSDNLDVDGKLLLTDGDLDFGANKVHYFAGNFEIESNGSITKGTSNTFIVFDGTTTLTDNSSGGPQNLGHVKVGLELLPW